VTWTVTNTGLYTASGSWTDQFFLDPVSGGTNGPSLASLAINQPTDAGTTSGSCPCLSVPTPSNSQAWDTLAFNGSLAPGESYTRTELLSLPSQTGQYQVRVVTDPDQTIDELSTTNNTCFSCQPLSVQAAYHATVSTTAQTVPTGTPIPLIWHRHADRQRSAGSQCSRRCAYPGQWDTAYPDRDDRRQREL